MNGAVMRRTILVIDDNPDDHEWLGRTLAKIAEAVYTFKTCLSGDDGLIHLADNTADCVLLDYGLPGSNGLAVLQRIRERHPHLPVVMLTGQGSEAIAAEIMKAGAQNYIAKASIQPASLHGSISAAIDQCRGQERTLAGRTANPVILIIDDNQDDRERYLRLLKKVPETVYRCLEAADGVKGMAMIDQAAPDCVLLDYSLPGHNGLEVLRRIRARHAFLPVILLTGQGNETVAVQAIKEGAHDYIIKSAVMSDGLHGAIKDAINHGAWKRALAEKDRQLQEKTAALAASEQHYRQLVDGVHDTAIYRLDPQGFVESWNIGAQRITGYAADAIIGQHFAAFCTEEDRNAREPQRALQTAAATGKYTAEGWQLRKDGARFWASLEIEALRDADGALIGFAKITRDITERKTMEAALRYSEKRNELAVQGLSIGLWDWNVATNDLYWSPRFKEIAGIDNKTFTARLSDFSERLHPEDKDEILGRLKQHLEHKAPYDVEYRLKRADGSYVWVHGCGQAEWDESGKPLRMVGSVEDITERKAVERMKNEFIAMVSHELRTPLTSIRGALGLIASGVTGDLPAKAGDLIQIAYKNSERLVRIINDILDVEKIESGSMQMHIHPVEIMPLLQQALEANRPYSDKYGVTLVLQGEPAAGCVLADPDRLMQVFANLLSNAVKFSPPGGTVHVATERRGDAVRFVVQDYGIGIPQEFRPKMFQNFSQADNSDTRRHEGTGLGLSIVKKFVEAMNGALGFMSEVGVGTTFYFDLPDADPAARRIEALPPSALARRTHVLICEDDPDVAQLLAMILGNSGFTSEIADTADAARQRIRSGNFTAVTMDLMLPDGDGIKLVREFKTDAATSNIPIVIVSAKADQVSRKIKNSDAVNNVADWLVKPLDDTRLVRSLERAVLSTGQLRPRVLHIEDDVDLSHVIDRSLQGEVELVTAATIREAAAYLRQGGFDLVILDPAMPDGSGLEFLNQIAAIAGRHVPVMILSASEIDTRLRKNVAAALVKSRVSERRIVDTILSLVPQRRPPTQGAA